MQRKTVKSLSLVIATLLTVSLSGCGSNGSNSGVSADKAPIRIGQATALTSEYTVVGQYLSNGTKMAVDEINAAGGISGRKIQLVQEDSANTNPAAVNAINKLIDSDNVVAIMGPDLSTQNFAVAPIINKAKIPFTVQGTNAKLLDGNPWFFRLRPDDGLAAKTAAKFAIEGLKKKKIGVTHDSDEFGVGGRDLIVKAVQDLGGTVVDEESYNSNDKDLTAVLTNIKNKGAEVIIDWGHPSQSATLQRQNKQLGINLPIIGSPGMGMPATIQLAGDAANGTYIVGDPVPSLNPDPKVQAWVKKYTDLYKAAPDFHSASAYDGIYMLKMAIEKAGSTDATAIQKALLTIKDYQGMGNTFTFTDGNGAHMVMITQIENGQNNKLIQTVKL